MQQTKDYLTINELAEQIAVSRKTVWYWIKIGRLVSHRIGAQHRIQIRDWDRYQAECNVTPTRVAAAPHIAS